MPPRSFVSQKGSQPANILVFPWGPQAPDGCSESKLSPDLRFDCCFFFLLFSSPVLRVDYCFLVFSFFIGSACFNFPSVGMGPEANKQPVCEADLGRRK